MVYARGWRLDEREILDALERWEKVALSLMWGCVLFYCYDCRFPKYASEKMLLHGQRPRCPICKKTIDIYDVGRLRWWKKELTDRTRAMLSRILRIFSEAADKCGGVKKWALLTSGVLEVSNNCARFWYDPEGKASKRFSTVMCESRRYLSMQSTR